MQSLLDHRLPQSEVDKIRALALAVDQVQGVHEIRTRMSGEIRFIQMHLELRDELLLIQAHSIADLVEDAVVKAFPKSDVIIHQDPMSVVKRN